MTKEEEIRKQVGELIDIDNQTQPLEKKIIIFLKWLVVRPSESKKSWVDFVDWWCEEPVVTRFFLPFSSSDWVAEEEMGNWNKFKEEAK